MRLWGNISRGKDPNRNHVTSTPFFKAHAANLARDGSHISIGRIQEAGVPARLNEMMQFMNMMFSNNAQYEAANKEKLERLAERIASEKTGLPKAMFKGELVNPNNMHSITNNPHSEGRARDEIKERMSETDGGEYSHADLSDAIEGHIPIQILSQGIGLNAMGDFDYMAKIMIDETRVPPEIIENYRKLSKALAGAHFLTDFYTKQAHMGAANLSSNESVEEEWQDENGKKGTRKIYAKAITFPLLVYELVSAGVRQAAHVRLNNNISTIENAKHFNAATGSRSVEALGFHAGPALERKFNEFVKFVMSKYADTNYSTIMRSLYAVKPNDRTLFFNYIMNGEFEDAAKTIRPKKD